MEDEARIYVGNNQNALNRTRTQVTTSGPQQGKHRSGLYGENGDVWPMSVIGVTKEIDIERDTSLSSKQRIEQA